jgi:hypothetical protein
MSCHNCCQNRLIIASNGDLILANGNTVNLSSIIKNLAIKTPFLDAVLSGTTLVLTYTDTNGATAIKNVSLATIAGGGSGITVSDTTTLDLNLTAGDISGSVILSPNAGNILSATASGLYATFTETNLVGTNTSSINLTTSGPTGHALQANIRISATAGNAISINSDGIYAPIGSTVLTAGTNVNISGVGSVGSPYLISAVNTPLTVTDSQSIDFTVSGLNNHTLTGAVIISPNAGNTLSILANGLYSSPITETILTVIDSNTFDFITSGTSGHTLTGNVKLSTNSGNLITSTSTGIYVTETPISFTGSPRLNVVVNGAYNHTITADVVTSALISSDAGNTLVNQGSGLYVPTVTSPSFVANDTSTIDFTTSGTLGHTLTGSVKISATVGNTIVANADGLYVPTSGGTDNWGTQVVQHNSTLTGNGTTLSVLGIAQQGATTGQALVWNGTTWAPGSVTGSDNWGTQVVATNATLTGNGVTGNVLSIAQQGAVSGQALVWNGTTWAPQNVLVSSTKSITNNGTSGAPIELVNDVTTPGNSYRYGTDASGAKGWYKSDPAIFYEAYGVTNGLQTTTPLTINNVITGTAGMLEVDVIGYGVNIVGGAVYKAFLSKKRVNYSNHSSGAGFQILGSSYTYNNASWDGFTDPSFGGTVDFDILISGSDIVIQITGETGQNIEWRIIARQVQYSLIP